MAETYLHAKFHLDPSNCLATVHQRHRQTDRTGQVNGPIASGEPFHKRSPKNGLLLMIPQSVSVKAGYVAVCCRRWQLASQACELPYVTLLKRPAAYEKLQFVMVALCNRVDHYIFAL